MRLRVYPDPVLRQVARPVEKFDANLANLAQQMLQVMRDSRGIGLAAPQVGSSARIFVANITGEGDGDEVFVNPKITARSGTEVGEEGCLSFPDIFIKVRRAARITVRYQDLEGNRHEIEAEGLRARCVQQEIDHLDGRLLIDIMTAVQRIANRRRLRELQRRFAEQAAKTSAP